jgi:K+-transporting ATPase ATPase C chain
MTIFRRQLVTALSLTITLIVLLGFAYPAAVWAVAQIGFNHQANGSFVKENGHVVGSSLIGQSFSDKNGNPLPKYFQPRPSEAGSGYDAMSSGASNLGPSNPLLIGFVPGVNTVKPDGAPFPIGAKQYNPFATTTDPFCVPMTVATNGTPSAPATSPTAGEKYAMAGGSYVCDPNTVPERAIAYRKEYGLARNAPVPVDAVTASGSGLDPDISEANALDQAPSVAAARHLPTGQIVALVHTHIRNRPWGILGENTVNVLDLNLALDNLR